MIEPDWIEGIADALARDGLDEAAVRMLRAAHPGVHFTCCEDDDVPAPIRPIAERIGFRIYLVDGRAHCPAFTDDHEAATGLVLARS